MTYEYACEACGHQWEAEQSIKDQPLKRCVSCGKDKAKRLISGGTGFLLKGGGWYADGYGSKSSSSASSSEESSASKSSSVKPDAKGDSAAASSESKPATDAKTSSTETKAAPAAAATPVRTAPAKAS
jgi:putative FmdB family regulatory protein